MIRDQSSRHALASVNRRLSTRRDRRSWRQRLRAVMPLYSSPTQGGRIEGSPSSTAEMSNRSTVNRRSEQRHG